MIKKLTDWAKDLDRKGIWLGKIIRLLYEICVSSGFQSAVHIIASCLLGAFAYKNNAINWDFIKPFAVVYLVLIFVFAISNQHRKIENNISRSYEIAYSRITKMLQKECHSNVELYNSATGKSFKEIYTSFKNHNTYTDICFQICEAVDALLQEISGGRNFRVMTFLRDTKDNNKYSINAYSPRSSVPESYGKEFLLNSPSLEDGVYVHAEPFLNKRFDPIIYNSEEVLRRYKDYHAQRPTKLYIGIPCDINGKIMITLQITSYDEALSKITNLNDLINNVLIIYTSYLKVAYTHQINHELIADTLEMTPV